MVQVCAGWEKAFDCHWGLLQDLFPAKCFKRKHGTVLGVRALLLGNWGLATDDRPVNHCSN